MCAATVYAWPPVGVIGAEWDYVSPISESISPITGKRYTSATKPERRVVTLDVSALSADRMGAGYMIALKRLLQGGENLVRLTSYNIRPYSDPDDYRQSFHLDWEDGSTPLDWTDSGIDLLWYDGTIVTGTVTTSGGFPALSITGLPANTLVASPGEIITVFEDEDDTTGSTVMAIAPAVTNGSGAVTVRLFSEPAYGGRVNIGVRDTAVFRAVGSLPRSMQVAGRDWSYGWSFEEVFSDEVGGFTEDTTWWWET